MSIAHVVSESHWRSACKGITYRVFSTLVTTAVSFRMTGSVKTAAFIGSAEVTAKVLLYWMHERLWARITWGHHHKGIVAAVAGRSAPPVEASEDVSGIALDVRRADEPSHSL